MITARPGSHVHQLLQLITAAGEIPASALPIIGNERVMAALVHKLESIQDIRFSRGGFVYHVRLIQVSGRKDKRTIRLYKKGLVVLDELYQGLLDWYLSAFDGHNFTGDPFHIWRNHRVAEVLALCLTAGIEIRPYVLPPLQKSVIRRITPESPCFYIARYFKKTDTESANKTMYTRITGGLFCTDQCFAVYNTRGAVMKWSGRGEVKALGNLLELARMNAGLDEVSAALLMGENYEVAINTILESDKTRRSELRFDKIYRRIHFIPLNQYGTRLLKMIIIPNWNEKLLNALFEPGQRSYNRGAIEYDAVVNGKKILSHLDGDIARLIRFREAQNCQTEPADVLCFPWQTGFLKSYLNGTAGLRELDMDAVEAALRE